MAAVLESLEARRLFSYTLSAVASLDPASGTEPIRGVTLDSSGNLFGTAYSGGANGDGTVFEVARGSSTAIALASFNGVNGSQPQSSITVDSAGDLFGAASAGGANNLGDVFEIVRGSHTITPLASFNGVNGEVPADGVTLDSAGDLFGADLTGGAFGHGTIFEIPKGSRSIKVLASAKSPEQSPRALVLDSAGNLYGASAGGGVNGAGAIFELPKGASSLTLLYSFFQKSGGQDPQDLTADSAGDLFGVTASGRHGDGDGTIFELARGSTTVTTLAIFNGVNGSSPSSTLLRDSSGDLFGTAEGGPTGDGTIFELVRGAKAVTVLGTFNGSDGSGPIGTLTTDSSGDIFGATDTGGSLNQGAVFKLAPNRATP